MATQIAEECEAVTQLVAALRTRTAVGGNNKQVEQRRIIADKPHILVATPGRLQDYLQDEHMRSMFDGLQTLVLDEADRLLDAGFKKEIDSIIRMLPNRERVARQTIMFSATVSTSVQDIARKSLDPNHAYISTVDPAEANSHEQIPQYLITLPDDDPTTQLPITVALIAAELAKDPASFKAMVFLPTARQTQVMASAFRALTASLNLPTILDIHSRKSQPARTKASDTFSDASSAILFSSDVTARGMDFPNVSHVIQLGLPTSGEQYIHRLGRTGRAGKEGTGFIVLYPFEARVFNHFKEIKPLPIKQYSTAALNVTSKHTNLAETAIRSTPVDEREKAYSAWLGFYKGFLGKFGWDAKALVSWANVMATQAWGLEEVPEMEARTIGKMGLKGVPGLNVVGKRASRDAGGPGGGSGGVTGGRISKKNAKSESSVGPIVDRFGQESVQLSGMNQVMADVTSDPASAEPRGDGSSHDRNRRRNGRGRGRGGRGGGGRGGGGRGGGGAPAAGRF